MKKPKINSHHAVRSGKKVRQQIIRATTLWARGKTFCEIAETLGAKPNYVNGLQNQYPDLWAAAMEQATENIIAIVRANAGTEKIMEDPDGWLNMAKKADRWCGLAGEELFPTHGALTLTTFYWEHYLPTYLFEAVAGTKEQYAIAVKRWRLVTGDPPIEQITVPLLVKFREFLTASRGLIPGNKLSPASVRRFLRYVMAVLGKAGPPGYRNRDAMGVVPQVPYIKLPRDVELVPKVVSADTLGVVYQKAAFMVHPQVAGIDPSQWWRSLLAVTVNTGLRRKNLFTLRMDDIDWKARQLSVPAPRMKSRRSLIVFLNDTAYEHLEAIKTDRELVFPWPYGKRFFDESFHRLQYEAGLPWADHFGLHVLRKTLATNMWKTNPEAARLTLGHASDVVTRRHYVCPDDILREAMDKLPQPSAFKGNGGNGHDE